MSYSTIDQDRYSDYEQVELSGMPLRGLRQYVAYTYMFINVGGFIINLWVLYIVAPVLFLKSALKSSKVPKSILFYILTLCFSDLMTMIAMVFLNMDIVFGTWRFGDMACTAYLLLDSMNKFIAPIIVFLISRTCYATVCLDTKSQERAASMRIAALQVAISLLFVLVILWPVFVYSQVITMFIRSDEVLKRVSFVRRCSFTPPAKVKILFNVVVSITSYAIPFCGFLYWYVSVPYFLWKRKGSSIPVSQSKLPNTVIRKVVGTVVILAVVYLLCWTPYWMGLYAHYFFKIGASNKTEVILMYFIHLMPYVSCAIYPGIFTFMNRAIKSAHSQFVRTQRRRLRNFTSETSKRIRERASMSDVYETSKTNSVPATLEDSGIISMGMIQTDLSTVLPSTKPHSCAISLLSSRTAELNNTSDDLASYRNNDTRALMSGSQFECCCCNSDV
ncbi:7 transmembrane receptor (rhodopsin family) domain-containing protein [Ditylenchus destructor]|uniref:7 transmembrane receptor (Rhodopsin family) domain-containing protein n=1 Tax=Ditylenchus destructor TaxID=166010 RepID=A0AAD4NJ01_9BILA|nr:7 transmembrane receptor (rhodopsin family) domain-containing protein [Ditylenchus destructor]